MSAPYRLERFNKETDEWETFWTHYRSMADQFLIDSDDAMYTSIGYISNPAIGWVAEYMERGFTVPHYDSWRKV